MYNVVTCLRNVRHEPYNVAPKILTGFLYKAKTH